MKLPKRARPIRVKKIALDEKNDRPFGKTLFSREKPGTWVSIRVCGENVTRLGVMLGALALGFNVKHDRHTRTLTIGFSHYNPAIWVPDLNRVVFGCESWWGVIDSPEKLRKITDADIENVWYVKALRELEAKAGMGETQ